MCDSPLFDGPLVGPTDTNQLETTVLLQLNWLSYGALLMCAERLLLSMGYCEVSRLATYRRGKTNHGGVDMVAKIDSPRGRLRVILQVKNLKGAVPSRSVDELHSAMERHFAQSAFILCTGKIAPKAVKTAAEIPAQTARLIDGNEFVRLLMDHRIGVRDIVDPKTGARSVAFQSEVFEAWQIQAEAERQAKSKRKRGFI